MAIFSKTHVNAYFIDNKKNQIEVIYKNESGQNISYNILDVFGERTIVWEI